MEVVIVAARRTRRSVDGGSRQRAYGRAA
jgi:hypothetical protein